MPNNTLSYVLFDGLWRKQRNSVNWTSSRGTVKNPFMCLCKRVQKRTAFR